MRVTVGQHISLHQGETSIISVSPEARPKPGSSSSEVDALLGRLTTEQYGPEPANDFTPYKLLVLSDGAFDAPVTAQLDNVTRQHGCNFHPIFNLQDPRLQTFINTLDVGALNSHSNKSSWVLWDITHAHREPVAGNGPASITIDSSVRAGNSSSAEGAVNQRVSVDHGRNIVRVETILFPPQQGLLGQALQAQFNPATGEVIADSGSEQYMFAAGTNVSAE